MRTDPPAIVLGGHENGMSVARSLGRRGVPVYALGCARDLRYSRHIRWIQLDRDHSRQEAWLEWLTSEGRDRLRGAVILPCNDDAVELVARHRAVLEPDYLLGDSNDAAVLTMLDKAHTYDLARQLGVPAPRVWAVDSRDALTAILPELPYPCALKPRHSHRFREHFDVKLLLVHNEAQLLTAFETVDRFGLQMLVTEIIPGADDQFCSYWTYLDEHGEPLFDFTKTKPRQYPIHFGLGTFHVSDRNPEVAALGRRFVQGAGLRGIAVVEFKRDARDGQLKLTDCNCRFTKALDIITRSGIDLAWLAYCRHVGRPHPPVGDYRAGVRLWFPSDDFRAFRSYQRAGELSLGRWLRSLRLPSHFALFHWSDPCPALAHGYRTCAARLGLGGATAPRVEPAGNAHRHIENRVTP
jgi:predicted ATP-grasp superfamily ATP-dependent carboligase